MVDKSKLLSILGLKDTNQGSSTGYNFLNSSGKITDVFSPVDGNKISSTLDLKIIFSYSKISGLLSLFYSH